MWYRVCDGGRQAVGGGGANDGQGVERVREEGEGGAEDEKSAAAR